MRPEHRSDLTVVAGGLVVYRDPARPGLLLMNFNVVDEEGASPTYTIELDRQQVTDLSGVMHDWLMHPPV